MGLYHRLVIYFLRLIWPWMVYMQWRKVPAEENVIALKPSSLLLLEKEDDDDDHQHAKKASVRVPIQVITCKSKDAAQKHPLIIYFHGGGGCAGSFRREFYYLIRTYAAKLQCTVVAVDYRLAPEHKFPCGMNDCIQATKQIISNIHQYICNGNAIVMGDSMGGLMAIAAANAFVTDKTMNASLLQGAALLAPVCALPKPQFESWKLYGTTSRELTSNLMEIFWILFLGMPVQDFEQAFQQETNTTVLSKAFPALYLDIPSNFPSTFMVTCETDILRDEGKAMARKLIKAGVKVQEHHYHEEHAFMVEGPMATTSWDGFMSDLTKWFNNLS